MKIYPIQDPVINEGITVKQAISRRHTSREFDPTPLNDKFFSEILWAAYGWNSPEGHRTTPSACGLYPLLVYAFTPKGVYLYHPEQKGVERILKGDRRAAAGMQDFVATAPMSLVVMTDFDRFRTGDPKYDAILAGNEMRFSLLDAGAVMENVYLYCTCAGLNVVERAMADETTLRNLLNLPENVRFVISMTIGRAPGK